MTTVQAALRTANQMLADTGVPNGPGDARRLMAAAMNIAPDRVNLHTYDTLSDTEEASFFGSILERSHGKPVSHLVGGRNFFDRWYVVTSDVLDPRPETEILVQAALAEPFTDVLDLGTGSGAILVTLLAENEAAKGMGCDVSEAALRIAEQNALAHEVAGRALFDVSDWYAAVGGPFDLIVSNPPYIAADEMDDLQPEVRLYEPRIALTDEADGLSAYRKIVAGAPDHLTPGGRLIVEIGPTQAASVCKMMENAGFVRVKVVPDLDGRDRVVQGVWPVIDQENRI